MDPRDTSHRVADAKRRLQTEANVWIATASAAGAPHLVALSLWWDGTSAMAATPINNPVARNIAETRVARLALADAEDVVSMKCRASVGSLRDLDGPRTNEMVEALGWDPRDETGEWSLLTMTPELVWAWNGLHEDEGRTIMRNGQWLS